MYFSSINDSLSLPRYPAVIERVLKYLRETDLAHMECGVYELEGKKLYVQLFETETGEVSERKPESHKQYLDVQYLVSGAESIGCTPYKHNYEVSEDLLAERDLLFYTSGDNETSINLEPGCFT
ncbi:MAG: YhcH/YjgK/YiaL family protein, partial [Oscillospiraceae bacterium]|nr:YhcH/YjgK/YiaL family protein [Oscillospiraceae bacterium]